MKCFTQLTLSALLLCLLPVFALSQTGSSKVSFNRRQLCPSNASLSQLSKLEGAQDIRSCFVACASNSNCSVLHRTNGICYFGTSTQLNQIFNLNASQSSDSCVSHAKDVLAMSKLIVFYDFRKGYTNIVSPGVFDATAVGSVTRDAVLGARFPGGTSDYIQVDTQGGSLATNYLDHPQNFSFYVKVVRQTYYQQTYHYFYDCSSTGSYGGVFADQSGRAWAQHRFPSVSGAPETRKSTAQFLSATNIPQAVSMGAVFYGKRFSNFYVNGTYVQADPNDNWSLSGQLNCLRLGFDSDPNKVLNGRMVCYGIAKDALSTEEFQQLDQICQW